MEGTVCGGEVKASFVGGPGAIWKSITTLCAATLAVTWWLPAVCGLTEKVTVAVLVMTMNDPPIPPQLFVEYVTQLVDAGKFRVTGVAPTVGTLLPKASRRVRVTVWQPPAWTLAAPAGTSRTR